MGIADLFIWGTLALSQFHLHMFATLLCFASAVVHLFSRSKMYFDLFISFAYFILQAGW